MGPLVYLVLILNWCYLIACFTLYIEVYLGQCQNPAVGFSGHDVTVTSLGYHVVIVNVFFWDPICR